MAVVERVAESVERQSWLDTLGEPLQNWMNAIFPPDGGGATRSLQNVLNGVWLGHPLHPVLTDVPIGAWTMAGVFDLLGAVTGDSSLDRAADTAVATGVAASLPTALTGLTDWKDTYGSERKVGLLHGLLMASSLGAYLWSLQARTSGNRGTGILLSTLGYGLMTAGAYLGGHEVYGLAYPVNRAALQHGPEEFVSVLREADLAEDTPKKVQADGVPVLLVRTGGQVYALADTCVHAGCSLADGSLSGRSIVCACHGSQYDLATGAVLRGPATMPEPVFDVRTRGGSIEVRQAPLGPVD